MSVGRLDLSVIRESFEIKGNRVHWRDRPRSHYLSDKAFKTAKARFFGKPFGCQKILHSKTYIAGNLTYLGEKYQMYEHTIVWCLVYGNYPELELDHIDRNGLNNEVSNLRDIDHTANLKNRGLNSNNNLVLRVFIMTRPEELGLQWVSQRVRLYI